MESRDVPKFILENSDLEPIFFGQGASSTALHGDFVDRYLPPKKKNSIAEKKVQRPKGRAMKFADNPKRNKRISWLHQKGSWSIFGRS